MKVPNDDKFVIRKWREGETWTVWLPQGHRYIGEGGCIMSAEGAGGFKSFAEARAYAVRRIKRAIQRGWRADYFAAREQAVLRLSGRSA
jgi:hypothetical protein